MSNSKNRICTSCEDLIPNSKSHGYYNLCSLCDEDIDVPKAMGIMIADGKTDYHTHIIHNPSPNDVRMIRQIGRAWDPRSQLTSINKVSK